MHTNSVLCRLFADIVHTLSRVNVFHSNAAARPAWGRRLFLRGRRSRGELAATAAGSYALVGDAGAAGGAAATTTTFEAQRSVVHRVPPPPLQDEGRRVISRGRAEASGHEERGAEARDWAGGGGMGPGVRAAGGASASSSARSGPAGPRCAGMREGRDARAGQRRGMHEGGLRPKVRGNTGVIKAGPKCVSMRRGALAGRKCVGMWDGRALARGPDRQARTFGNGAKGGGARGPCPI
jgi:hypothetical protein